MAGAAAAAAGAQRNMTAQQQAAAAGAAAGTLLGTASTEGKLERVQFDLNRSSDKTNVF